LPSVKRTAESTRDRAGHGKASSIRPRVRGIRPTMDSTDGRRSRNQLAQNASHHGGHTNNAASNVYIDENESQIMQPFNRGQNRGKFNQLKSLL